MTESKKLSSKKRTKNPPKFVLKKPLQPNSTDIFVYLTSSYKKRIYIYILSRPSNQKEKY